MWWEQPNAIAVLVLLAVALETVLENTAAVARITLRLEVWRLEVAMLQSAFVSLLALQSGQLRATVLCQFPRQEQRDSASLRDRSKITAFWSLVTLTATVA